MNVTNDVLEQLVARDRYQEILEVLGPAATAVVALQMEDELTEAGVGELLGISRAAVSMRLSIARGRLIAHFPELARHYGYHGVKVGTCCLCGKPIARDARWCQQCWHKAERALAAVERGDFGQDP